MMKLLNSILDLSKLEANQFSLHLEETALNTELSALISPFYAQAKEKQIQFTEKVESSVSGKVVCDWALISQILINLLSNAIKFTPHHGRVDVVVSVEQESDIEAKLNFSVSDTGPGIPVESIPKIFEPFNQLGNKHTKNKGTGLGLTLAQKKAQLMGGAIDVKSAVGRGSVFTLSVPIKLEQKTQIERTGSGSRISDFKNLGNLFSNRVVIFEDEEITAMLMQTWFRKAGFNEFKVIASPEEFQDFLNENSFAEYPLFIVDKNIGDLEGAQVVQDLRNLPSASKKTIIMNSGDPLDPAEEKTWAALLDGFDLKPIDYEVLFKKLEKLGRERSANPLAL
jgi:CheY-like chemotaxis protein